MHYDEGKTYDFTFTDGTARRLRYEGFDQGMKTIWRDVNTGEVTNLLPTVQSHTRID
ncbi:hypothetical protein BH09PSE6_BH09PSE6_24110 [soil metagenome]